MAESNDVLEKFVTGMRLDGDESGGESDDEDDDSDGGTSAIGSVDNEQGTAHSKDEDIDTSGQKEGSGSVDEGGQTSDDGGQFIGRTLNNRLFEALSLPRALVDFERVALLFQNFSSFFLFYDWIIR